MGAGISASPHLRRAKDPPVFVSLFTRRFPALRSWLTSSGVASDRGRVPKDTFSIFRGPSWTNLLSRRLHPEGGRVSRKSDWLFRRLFRLVRIEAEASPHRLPVEIGLSIPSLRGGLGLPSRSPIPYEPAAESLKADSTSFRLWIMGISRISRRAPQLPFCSHALTAFACPTPIFHRPTQPISLA